MRRWQLQDAKARLSELVKRSAVEGPQGISVHGKPAAVVLSIADDEKAGRKKRTMDEFVRRSARVGIDLEIERDRCPARPVEL